MSEFKKKFHIPCDCFLPCTSTSSWTDWADRTTRATGVTGPTGPAATACCPCTNVLDNPGFDEPATPGTPVPGWIVTGNVSEVGFPNAHSGRFLPNGILSALAVSIGPGGIMTQSVDVGAGCCFTLSLLGI